MKIYTIYDRKVAQFSAPFVAHNEAVAMRRVQSDMLNNPGSPYFTHADDFDVYCCGTFDIDSGLIDRLDVNDGGPVFRLRQAKEALQDHIEAQGRKDESTE